MYQFSALKMEIKHVSKGCHSCGGRNPRFPVKTGIQFLMVSCFRRDSAWIPVFTGMTEKVDH